MSSLATDLAVMRKFSSVFEENYVEWEKSLNFGTELYPDLDPGSVDTSGYNLYLGYMYQV